MDPTTRPYARRILLLHLVLLLAVVALVGFAADEVYNRARDQLIAQARSRQELLAKQTASAIDSYYSSITADLNFLRRSEDTPGAPETSMRSSSPPPPPRLLRPLWNQLEGRVSHILYVHRQTLAIMHAYPENTNRDEARVALQPFASWLRDLDKPGVSPYRPTRYGGANLIAVPLNNEYALAAIVPVSNVEDQFFRVVRDRSILATLLDENGVVMVTSDLSNPSFAPATMPAYQTSATRPGHRMLARMRMSELIAGTREYGNAGPLPFNNSSKHHSEAVKSEPRLTTVEPLHVDDRTFYVIINSPISDITAAATTLFIRAFIGGIFVILSVTAILLSTAIRLIRARQRLESLQHEMLTRELNQARAIQLHWLPTEDQCPSNLQIAAVNHTANHISGDFYDWFTLPDGRAVVSIGDVTGHGMSAAFLMATTQLLVRNTLPLTADPAACLQSVNKQLCAQSFHGQFVTILLLILDPRTSTLSCATAGHMPPLLRNTNGFAPLELEPQLPLGIDPDTTYKTESLSFPGGSTLLLYTDGIPDAAAADGSRFTLQRMISTLNATDPEQSPRVLVDEILSAVTTFRGAQPLTDDLTLVALTFAPAFINASPRFKPASLTAP
ncbi:MAG TPA: SpoIIE family protein phosphatase [Tepidisphaeraceae bacterium]|jgi:sigma-B regulation protein RsbU (phosphoserine phosphatase)|nr:SpoIIE family protein phosphatase [Tepidisphaeraceae bacterium]